MKLNEELVELGLQLTATTITDVDRLESIRERLFDIILLGDEKIRLEEEKVRTKNFLHKYVPVVNKHLKEGGFRILNEAETVLFLDHLREMVDKYDPVLAPIVRLGDLIPIEAAAFPMEIHPDIDDIPDRRKGLLKVVRSELKDAKARKKARKKRDRNWAKFDKVLWNDTVHDLILEGKFKKVIVMLRKALVKPTTKRKKK